MMNSVGDIYPWDHYVWEVNLVLNCPKMFLLGLTRLDYPVRSEYNQTNFVSRFNSPLYADSVRILAKKIRISYQNEIFSDDQITQTYF